MFDIIIELEKIRDPFSGLGQFCSFLSQAISKKNLNLNIAAIVPKGLSLKGIQSIPEKRTLFKFSMLLPEAKLWHLTHQDPRYIPSRSKPYILTVHDLNDLIEKPNEKDVIKIKLENLFKQARHIVCISEYTKKEVLTNFPFITNISVIKNGVPTLSLAEEPRLIPSKPFFFSVGTVIKKKNFQSIVNLAKIMPDDDFIIAGSTDNSFAKNLIDNAPKNVTFTGKISDSEKSWYHQKCKAFIFPSFLEGFGLPVVEAMSVGKPLFLSKLTSLPEIGGEDAFYFDNFNPESMNKVIIDGLSTFSTDQSNRLIERSKIFSWDEAAIQYLKLYQSLV